jgi:hypothetical protein
MMNGLEHGLPVKWVVVVVVISAVMIGGMGLALYFSLRDTNEGHDAQIYHGTLSSLIIARLNAKRGRPTTTVHPATGITVYTDPSAVPPVYMHTAIPLGMSYTSLSALVSGRGMSCQFGVDAFKHTVNINLVVHEVMFKNQTLGQPLLATLSFCAFRAGTTVFGFWTYGRDVAPNIKARWPVRPTVDTGVVGMAANLTGEYWVIMDQNGSLSVFDNKDGTGTPMNAAADGNLVLIIDSREAVCTADANDATGNAICNAVTIAHHEFYGINFGIPCEPTPDHPCPIVDANARL